MKQTNWPDVTPINQKNYYTYASIPPPYRHLPPSCTLTIATVAIVLMTWSPSQ